MAVRIFAAGRMTPNPRLFSPVRALQRLFTRGRLARRFALVSLMLGVVLAVLIGTSLYMVSSRHLARQHYANVQANAALVARQTEGLLTTLVNTMRDLASNRELTRALADSGGKDSHLLPFLRSVGQIASVPVALIFTDAKGEPVGDNGQRAELRITPGDLAWLERAVAARRSEVAVVKDGARLFLLAADIPTLDDGGAPGGALLYKAPLSALVLHPEATLIQAGAAVPPVPAGRMAVEAPLRVSDRLAPLGLVLRLEASAAPTGAFLSWVLPAYGLVALASLIGIYFGSRAVGSHMTRSLRELERLAGTIVSHGFIGQRARVRGDDEVAGLATTFNAMLDHIAAIQRERDLRAAEEITIQRTFAERAGQARAEAEDAKTEAERARQEAIMALMVAERANTAKTHFLAAASHDLRQPVQSLVLLTAALAVRLGDHPASSLVGKIEASINALCRLLDAILDMSKLDAGAVSPTLQTVSLGAVFQRLEDEYRLRAAEKGIRFRAAPTSVTLSADPALLERIIRNLVENALRYTERGRIVLGCRRHADGVRIQVHDTGIGIPAEHLERIFHEFYQIANPARDRGKGLGLGLAIVDRLARLLKYRVEVASTPGKGSCFTIRIDGQTLDRVAVLPSPGSGGLAGVDGGVGLALVIDDDPLVREGLTLLIEQCGWRVLACDGAASAVRALTIAQRSPDLVIADLRLEAGESGLDAIGAVERTVRTILKNPRSPLCVVLTGDTAPERITDAKASGHRILHKPVAAKDIAALLSEALPTLPAAARF
jgi:two-component system, sensor histidine kinase